MRRSQINLNKQKLDNLVPINPEKKGVEMTEKMGKEVEGAEEEEGEPCNHICKVLARCQDKCLGCPMDQVTSEPHHFQA